MKKLSALVSALLLAGCISAPESSGPRLSTFGCHLVDAANQHGISVLEMSKLAKSWGYDGVDLMVGKDEAYVDDFLKAGLKPSVIIVFAEFGQNASSDRTSAAIAYAKRTGCNRIMVVPGFLEKGEKRDALWPTVMRNLSAFVGMCKAEGLDVAIEDFDHDKALVGSAAHIRKAFTEIPDLGLVLDTGNFAGWGEDVIAATREFLPRIRHVHLKDRDKVNPKRSVTIGTGKMPMREVCNIIRGSGYKGWFTVECFEGDEIYSALRDSAKWFKAD